MSRTIENCAKRGRQQHATPAGSDDMADTEADMAIESSFVSAADSLTIATYRWNPPSEIPRGIVQIAHGAAEYALRYNRLALALSEAGYIVYANDHRGHGRSFNEFVPIGAFGSGGWDGLVADVAAFSRSIRADHPDLGLFLLGHSMGSMASQYVVVGNSELYAGLILSGSTTLDSINTARLEAEDDVPMLERMNAGFERRTGFEWLSRDEAEVDKYVADPLCGFAFTDGGMRQSVKGAARLADPTILGGIRHDLPILLISGRDDPISQDGQLVRLLADRYRAAGLADVAVQLYEGARHELFNEINRDEVTRFVIDWLNHHEPARA
jgi:alpha-beta hydrolase superfamily lysophospholipase